jgi:hypothetical protein
MSIRGLNRQLQQMDVNAEDSTPQFCPRPVLKKLIKYVISLLAVFADGKWKLSGSNGLEVFCPGKGSTRESDFDVYGVANPDTIVNIMHVLRFAPVRWNNFLGTYATQERKYGLALLPRAVIVDLAEKLEIHPQILKAYLKSRYNLKSLYSHTSSGTRHFVAAFVSAYKEYWLSVRDHSFDDCSSDNDSSDDDESTSKTTSDGDDSTDEDASDEDTSDEDTPDENASDEDASDDNSDEDTLVEDASDENAPDDNSDEDTSDDMIWLYKYKDSKFYKVPPEVGYLVRLINSWPTVVVDNDVKLAMEVAKEAWTGECWPEELFEDYIRNRAWNRNATTILNFIFNNSRCSKPWTGPYHRRDAPGEQRAHGDEKFKIFQGDEEFRILQGTLSDSGNKIQLILISDRKKGVLHTTLGHYATHTMCGIGGTQGYHLYFPWETLEKGKSGVSYEVDVSKIQWKQNLAPAGKDKYKDRGWTFVPLNTGIRPRTGGDKHVKRTDYEYIYKSALRDGGSLPKWWEDYFKSREAALVTSSWTEMNGEIVNVFSGDNVVSQEHSLLDWVQDSLAGHPHVIPQDEWDKREDIEWIELDLWFGGAGELARELHIRRQYDLEMELL